jgi:hypothetical protein
MHHASRALRPAAAHPPTARSSARPFHRRAVDLEHLLAVVALVHADLLRGHRARRQRRIRIERVAHNRPPQREPPRRRRKRKRRRNVRVEKFCCHISSPFRLNPAKSCLSSLPRHPNTTNSPWSTNVGRGKHDVSHSASSSHLARMSSKLNSHWSLPPTSTSRTPAVVIGSAIAVRA